MHASTVAIDLAKEVFELAFADAQGRIIERKRLSRRAFIRSLETRPPLRVLMEACGGAHCCKAACALANKLARRLWAMDHHGTPFDPRHVSERPRAA